MRILGDVTTATTATGALCMGGAEGVWGATTVFAGDWFNGTRKQLPGEVLSRKRGQQQALRVSALSILDTCRG